VPAYLYTEADKESFDSKNSIIFAKPYEPSKQPPEVVLHDLSMTSDSPKLDKKEKFKFIARIGEGAFGQVYKAQHLSTKKIYAIKKLDKAQLKKSRREKEA